MIVTVTPNSSIDKTYIIEEFGIDRLNRPSEDWVCAGGKGINVARVLKVLARPVLATGFAGGRLGDMILTHLSEEGIRHDFVRSQGESRLCIKIVDPKRGTQTEINEQGPTVSAAEVDQLAAKIEALLGDCEMLMLCGNCPPGVPNSFYAELVAMARRRGVRAIVDASGDVLRRAVEASPFMLKPNVAELSELAGADLCTLEEIARAAKSLKQFGITVTAVTMGRSGALVTDGVHSWQATAPKIEFASAVGSGDSFLAAFVDSLLSGADLPESLRWATAAGAANATTYQAGFCSKESIIEMKQGVSVAKID